MIKYKFLPILFILIFFSYSLTFARDFTTGGINREQPISIGEIIYSKLIMKTPKPAYLYAYFLQYFYQGIENDNIKVKCEYKETTKTLYEDDEDVETDILTLLLNANRQTLLKTKKIPYSKSEELVIKVVDDFNRIFVEEYQK